MSSGKEYGGVPYLKPVLGIRGAHDDETKGKGRKKTTPLNKSVTSLSYAEGQPYTLISSGSNDG
jgi:denticleless